MLTIAGGIVLGVLLLNVVGELGADDHGEFSLGVLFGNVLAIGLALCVIAAIAIFVLVKLHG